MTSQQKYMLLKWFAKAGQIFGLCFLTAGSKETAGGGKVYI
jgi:hypothetical protein